MCIYFKQSSISNKQTISYINQSSKCSVGFGNLRRCGTLLYPSAVRCGAVQGFSNGLIRQTSMTGWKVKPKNKPLLVVLMHRQATEVADQMDEEDQ